MKKKLFQNKIVVKPSRTHGYGVFTEKKLRKGEMIEECYIIVTKGGDKKLESYYFEVSSKQGQYAIFTGFGMIYNHSDDPNADYIINLKKHIVTIKADRTIEKGEELFISYGDEWFSSRGLQSKEKH